MKIITKLQFALKNYDMKLLKLLFDIRILFDRIFMSIMKMAPFETHYQLLFHLMVLYYISSISAIIAGSKSEDIDSIKCNKDVGNVKGLDSCDITDNKEGRNSVDNPDFKSIVAYKTHGRLGNRLWSYMHLMYVEFRYNLSILTEEQVKSSLAKVFKNVDHIKIVANDTCGYKEFFNEYENAAEAMIVSFLEKKSGVKVSLERSDDGVTIHPEEVAEKYGKEVSKRRDELELQLLQEFKANYDSISSTCQYKVNS